MRSSSSTAPAPDHEPDVPSQARRSEPLWKRRNVGRPRATLIGIVIGLIAIVVKTVIDNMIGVDTGFILLAAAAVIASWYAGAWAGVAAAALTAFLHTLLVMAPEPLGPGVPSLRLDAVDIARVALFLVSGLGVSVLVSNLRTSRDDVTASLDDVARMARDIERRDERLEMVLAASATGFWDWDIRSGELTWSKAIFDQHGLPSADGAPTYERYMETIHPEDRETLRASIESALATGRSFSHEFRILWPDASVHWTHGVGRVFLGSDGAPVRMMGTGQDITERRRVEQERDRLLEDERRAGSFREAFIDVISHELRTPITTILGLTQILRRAGGSAPDADRVGLIDDVAAESERLHRLVEDLLVLTRSERGAISIDAEPLELRRLLTRLIEREQQQLTSIKIDLDVADDLPIVAGEATYVEQVVRNMLGNAAKYAGNDGRVTVTATRQGDVVAIRVLDQGEGIDDEISRHAFDLFYRDPVRARTVAGSGIGLFVCSSLVTAMGGSVWARRRDEGGSEFGFTLRAIVDDETGIETTGVAEAEPVTAEAGG